MRRDSISVDRGQGAGETIGAPGDTAVVAGAMGSISAKLRALSRDLVANIVLHAGSAIVGQVGIDQTTPGTTNNVSVTTLKPDGTNAMPSMDSEAHPGFVEEAPIAAASADVHEPAANTAAVVTYAGVPSLKHIITGVAWSYSGGIPVGGNLLIEDVAGTTVFSVDITEEGPGFVVFPSPKKAAAVNTAIIVTLAAGGAGITGKLSVLNHKTEV